MKNLILILAIFICLPAMTETTDMEIGYFGIFLYNDYYPVAGATNVVNRDDGQLILTDSDINASTNMVYMDDVLIAGSEPATPQLIYLDIRRRGAIVSGESYQFALTGYYTGLVQSNHTTDATWTEVASAINVTLNETGLVSVDNKYDTENYSFYASYLGRNLTNTTSIVGVTDATSTVTISGTGTGVDGVVYWYKVSNEVSSYRDAGRVILARAGYSTWELDDLATGEPWTAPAIEGGYYPPKVGWGVGTSNSPAPIISYGYTQDNLPDLITTGAPTTNFPASFAAFAPPISEGFVAEDGTPAIAEWTRQSDSGDTMALTGEDL
jgi:hypothetical protein